MRYYLGIDIGASSGRHMLTWLENGVMKLEEIHRFSNGMEKVDGHLCWNLEKLFREILTGMQKCKDSGRLPDSVGIDTWAVDYVLLDGEDRVLGQSYAYRDHRTEAADGEVYKEVSPEELYRRTGIQKQPFNTIYQLMACKLQEPENLERAEALLMIPDYFHFRLTGVKVQEYTNATTTQLVNAQTKDWDRDLINCLGFPERLFQPILMPGTEVGRLLPEIIEEVGYDCKVVLPATHDTASAVMAVPAAFPAEVSSDKVVLGNGASMSVSFSEPAVLYISSGTWSLMGCERREADCSMAGMEHNFTNEGGYEYRYRYLKNIMGLWMIQSVRRELAEQMSFGEICEGAAKETIASLVDVNDGRFLAPESMAAEVQAACRESGQAVPEGLFPIAAVIYNSLAKCYADTMGEIEAATGVRYPAVHIVGGGANADYLNHLTAKECGRPVLAGPVEATVIGNAAAQMIAAGELGSLEEARECVGKSFEIVRYET